MKTYNRLVPPVFDWEWVLPTFSKEVNDTYTRNGITAFWGGPLSNTFPSIISMPLPVKDETWLVIFPSAESAFQAFKALEFSDFLTLEAILKADSPLAAKDLGNRVEGYKEEVWRAKATHVMKWVLEQKFGTNTYFCNLLLGTGDTTIVEASPEDRIWGVGVGMPEAFDRANWKGQNLQGQSLMRTRARLRLMVEAATT